MFFLTMVPAILLGWIYLNLTKSRVGFQREFRDKAEGFNDILRYNRMIAPGIALEKGGELVAGFHFRGVDMDSSTNDMVMALMARLNSGLALFDEDWVIHVDQSRLSLTGYPEQGHFPHPLLALIDQQRRRQFESEGDHFEGFYALTITWKPPSLFEARISSMFYESSEDVGNDNIAQRYLKKFEERVVDCGKIMQGMFHDVRRMTVQEVPDDEFGEPMQVDALATYLHYCATGKRHFIRTSATASQDLDTLVASENFIGGNNPRVGKMFIRPIAIDGYPAEAAPLVLEALNRLPVEYRWSTRFIFMDQESAKTLIGRIRKKWKQKLRPIVDQLTNKQGGIIDQDAALMVNDTEAAYAEASSGMVRNGLHTSVVILMDEDAARLNDSCTRLQKMIGNLGFPSRLEEENAVEAFLGSLPGHIYENVRKPMIHTMNLAYLFPASATWAGVKKHPCKFYNNAPPLFVADASGSTPFSATLHVDDVGHFKLIGPTGSGKSTALQFFIAQQFRYENARVFLFEKGYSGYVLCKATGGKHYDIGGEEDNTLFAPLADIHIPFVRSWAEGWLISCLELQGVSVIPAYVKEIRAVLELMAEGNVLDRTMSHLVGLIQNEKLREALSFYTVDGSCPSLDAIPGDENIDFGLYNVFEMEHLMTMGEKYVAPILLYLFHKIERSLKGNPTWIVLDEAWLMLMHPLWRDYILKWLKTLRKANTSVGFATQEVGDAAKSVIADVIFSSCPTSILLPNPDIRRAESMELYRQLGLNEQQMSILQYGTQKRDYYYTSPLGSRLFSLSLDPLTLSIVGASGKEEVALAKQLQKDYGDRWVVEWTRRRAGPGWAAEVEKTLTV